MKAFTRARATLFFVTMGLYLTLWAAPPLSWDDDSNIFANPLFRAGDWSTVWTSAYFGLYVPVTSTLWHLLYVGGDGAAWPFRVLNAGLHTVNTILVYIGLAALARRRGRASAWPALLGAAVFALHPLQVGAVAWISGGRDLLATGFALGAILLYFVPRRALASLLFAAACLSKPSVVVLPAVIFVLAPVAAPDESRRRHLPWLAGWALLGLAVIAGTLDAQAGHLPAVAWWRRPWLMGDAYWFYQSRLVNTFGLAANYARTPAAVFARPLGGLGAAAGAGLLGLGLRSRASAPWVAAWALALLPVSGLVAFGYQETSGVADHYAYFALALVAALVAEVVAARLRLALLAPPILALWAAQDVWRLRTWRSNEAFFTAMSVSAPASYATGIGMSGVACAERRDYADGVRWTDVALAQKPLDVRALANQAYCLLHAREFKRVVELEFYFDRLDQGRLAATEPTGFSSFLASVGAAKIETGDLKNGYQFLCEAARVMPGEPIHQRNLDLAGAILRGAHVPADCADADEDE